MNIKTEIEKKIIEWRGKTLASHEQFESELRDSFTALACTILDAVEAEVSKAISNSKTLEEGLGVGIREETTRAQVLLDVLTSIKKLKEEIKP